MGAAGLKVDGVDVTTKGDYDFTTGAAANGKVTISTAAASGTAAVMTLQESSGSFDFTAGSGTVASFESLAGTISFGGKSFDLTTVEYKDTDGNGTTTGTEMLASLNTAAKSALGLTTNPFAGSATGVTFTVTDAVSGYTGTSGFALSDSAQDKAKATATFTAASGAEGAINKLDAAIKTVSTQRADLGAIQNRFDHTINNLNVAVENLTASESRIRDADMAQEMVQFTRNQILSQAGTAMLAQANQASQGVLSLLR
jgi:flagellin